MRAKYGILDYDFYNFDETGFIMGVISPAMVVTHADRRGRDKAVQPGNREWATAIVCVNNEGWNIPPFLVVQGNGASQVGLQKEVFQTIGLSKQLAMDGPIMRQAWNGWNTSINTLRVV